MDIQKLRQIVFEKTGIRVDEVDPVFTVVALNEAMFEDMIDVYQQALAKNNNELDEKIGSLVVLHRKLVDASQDLVERANQAHLNAALKAATEAKADIMTAARIAISAELEKAAAIVTNAAHQLASAGEKVKANSQHSWAIAITQAVIGGMVAGMVILTAFQLK
jgi:hypothetical protein